jgi:hypothetical protein
MSNVAFSPDLVRKKRLKTPFEEEVSMAILKRMCVPYILCHTRISTKSVPAKVVRRVLDECGPLQTPAASGIVPRGFKPLADDTDLVENALKTHSMALHTNDP